MADRTDALRDDPRKRGLVLMGVGLPLAACYFIFPSGLTSFLLLVGIPTAGFGALIALIYSIPANRRAAKEAGEARQRNEAALAEHGRAGARVGMGLGKSVISGQLGALAYEHFLAGPESKNGPPRPTVRISASAPGEFTVTREGAASEFAKTLGMVREFQTGDAALDRRLFFAGTTDEYVREVFGAPANLAVVRALLALGFDRVEKSGKHLAASMEGRAILRVAEVQAAVDQLAKLRLPPVVAGTQGKFLVGQRPLYVVCAVALLIVAGGVASLWATKPMVNGWPAFFSHILPLAAALFVGLAAGAWFLVRGRSMSALGLAQLLVCVPLVIPALFGALALANQALDWSAAEEHQVRAMRHWFGQNKSGHASTFFVEFESWRGRSGETLTVAEADYWLSRDKPLWKLRVRRGLLGQPWIETMEPAR